MTTPRFVLLAKASGSTLEADSVSELVDKFVPLHGQVGGDDTESQMARLDLRSVTLSHYAALAQGTVLASIPESEFEELDEDALTILLHDRDEQVVAVDWDKAFPLFLSALQYEPYTDAPRPTGNVVFLDPTTERSFLDSLQMAGIAELHINDDDPDDGDEGTGEELAAA